MHIEGQNGMRITSIWASTLLLTSVAFAQASITLSVNTASREFEIPADFVGLGFETKSVLPNTYGVRGYFFSPENKQLIRLFQNAGVKHIRVGGGTVDGSGGNEHCVIPIPTRKDIDNLFEFAQLAGVKVIYSFRLLNLSECANENLASDNAPIAQYIWNKYRASLDSFSIGNEPDVRGFHSYPGHAIDPQILETNPGVPGSAYPSFLAAWRHFASAILKLVPSAKFSGPDTAVSSRSSFTPDPATGASWTQQFASDLKSSGIVVEALQHHYVYGRPGSTTADMAIDNMLSPAWDTSTSQGTQPAGEAGAKVFNPYPFVYNNVLAPLVSLGVPYRMTEANDCLHGVEGASNGYAAALWALDYMHWWAAHHMAGVNFHNNPWLPTDTVVPDPNPCPPSGCGNYRITAKAYALKAFDLGSHGYVEPVVLSNPKGVNLTAYAVGTDRELYVTVINKTHSTTRDAIEAAVAIEAQGFGSADADYMVLSGSEPGSAAGMTAMLGGASITNNAPWTGKWTPIGRVSDGKVAVTVQSATAAIVRIRAR